MVNIGRRLCPRPKSSGWSIRDDYRRHSPTVPTVGFLPTVVGHRSRDAFSQRQSEFKEEYKKNTQKKHRETEKRLVLPYMRTGRVQRRIKIVFSVAYSNRGNSVRRSSC